VRGEEEEVTRSRGTGVCYLGSLLTQKGKKEEEGRMGEETTLPNSCDVQKGDSNIHTRDGSGIKKKMSFFQRLLAE